MNLGVATARDIRWDIPGPEESTGKTQRYGVPAAYYDAGSITVSGSLGQFTRQFDYVSNTVLVGIAATKDALRREQDRSAMCATIDKFARHGLSWSHYDSTRITQETRASANVLVSSLSQSKQLPKIAPDGDGSLMLLWENGNQSVLLTVDGWKMHVVFSPATPAATYIENIPYDGVTLPSEVFAAIPSV